MMKIIFYSALLILSSCSFKSESDRIADEHYDNFVKYRDGKEIGSTYMEAQDVIAYSSDPDKVKEARIWIIDYEKRQEEEDLVKLKKHIIELDRLDSLGGVTAIEIENTKKCNRTMASYVLNKPITDSDNVKFITRLMADSVFTHSKRDKDCTYPPMASIFIYLTKKDYNVGNWIAMCAFAPEYYYGRLTLNQRLVK